MKPRLCVLLICVAICGTLHGDEGALVIVGGGGTPDVVIDKMVALAGGTEANVVILPQASSREDRGQSSVEMFTRRHVKTIDIVETDTSQDAREKIGKANLIWFPGGQQKQLMEALTKADLIDPIIARQKAGCVVGGTSAGAAVMALDMIPSAPEKQALRHDNTPVIPGLGLAPNLIVDQHFVARSRMNRLLSAVVDHPNRVGVGIGERTAVILRNGAFDVLGEGSVVIIDARQSSIAATERGQLQAAKDIQLHLLKSGARFEFEQEDR